MSLQTKHWSRIYRHYISISRYVRPSKRTACSRVTQQLTTSEGLALKLCNVSDCFPTIIPPSSLTQLPVTSTNKGHTLEGYFLCRATHTFIHMHLHHTCTSTHTGRGHILRNDTIVLVVARSRCNLWWDRVAGLAPHHCLPTRWWAFADRVIVLLLYLPKFNIIRSCQKRLQHLPECFEYK